MSSTVLYLVRSTETPFGTFGTLLTDKGHPLIITLENPWRNNEPFVSCIPVGTYAFNRHLSPKFGETFIVEGVPERTNIPIQVVAYLREKDFTILTNPQNLALLIRGLRNLELPSKSS